MITHHLHVPQGRLSQCLKLVRDNQGKAGAPYPGRNADGVPGFWLTLEFAHSHHHNVFVTSWYRLTTPIREKPPLPWYRKLWNAFLGRLKNPSL